MEEKKKWSNRQMKDKGEASDPQSSHIWRPEKSHVFCHCSEPRNQNLECWTLQERAKKESGKKISKRQLSRIDRGSDMGKLSQSVKLCKCSSVLEPYPNISYSMWECLKTQASDPDWSECWAGNYPTSAHLGTSQRGNPGVRSSYPLTPHKALQQHIYLGNQNPRLTIQNLVVKVSICDISFSIIIPKNWRGPMLSC